jgi:L-fucose mutarotase/ribose pyranase (RbsD/FucU family)
MPIEVMSKSQRKHKRVSMKETAELQADKVITIQREVKYDDEQISCSEVKVMPRFSFYQLCKKHFALQRSGDWNTIAYEWTNDRWVDSQSNQYWLLDET